MLEILLYGSPQDLGLAAVNWTVPLLRAALALATEGEVSERTLRRELHRLDYACKGPRHDLDPEPEREKKRWIRRQVWALPRRSVVLAQDDTDLLLFPSLRAAWAKRGEPARVRLSARNARRVIFGVLNLRTGARLFVPRDKGRSVHFQAFVADLRSHHRGWHVVLLLDEDSCDTARASRRAAEGMALLWLPKRSPTLNPLDTLWGQGKDIISANKQYATIDEQPDRFVAYVHGLTNRDALHMSGVLSDKL